MKGSITMCYYLYLFSDEEFQESKFDKDNPGLFVLNVTHDGHRGAIAWKNEKFAYYIGGYQGCGCGWCLTEFDDEIERAQKIADRDALKRFISCAQSTSFRFISGYEGSQGEKVVAINELKIDEFLSLNLDSEDPVEYLVRK